MGIGSANAFVPKMRSVVKLGKAAASREGCELYRPHGRSSVKGPCMPRSCGSVAIPQSLYHCECEIGVNDTAVFRRLRRRRSRKDAQPAATLP